MDVDWCASVAGRMISISASEDSPLVGFARTVATFKPMNGLLAIRFWLTAHPKMRRAAVSGTSLIVRAEAPPRQQRVFLAHRVFVGPKGDVTPVHELLQVQEDPTPTVHGRSGRLSLLRPSLESVPCVPA